MHPLATIVDMLTNDGSGINHVYNSESTRRWSEETVDLRRIWRLEQVERHTCGELVN